MPDYEFICSACHQIFIKQISYQEYGKLNIACPKCGSGDTRRHINRVRLARSESSRLEEMNDWSDAGKIDQIEKDPAAMGRMMRKMSDQVGEDMGGEFNEVIERLEKGQTVEDIENNLPLSSDDSSIGGTI